MESFDTKSLAIIKQSGILAQQDFTNLAKLSDELAHTFLTAQVFRTRTEMEASVLNDIKFPTPDSKYWQCIREQNVMYSELVNLSYEYRKNQVEIMKMNRDIDYIDDEFDKELAQIEIERRQFAALNQERTAKDRIREIGEWHDIMDQLKPQMTASFDDVNEHQLVSYTARWIQQARNMAGETGVAERNNLIGQLDKGLKLCKERGAIPSLLKLFPGDRNKEDVLKLMGISKDEYLLLEQNNK